MRIYWKENPIFPLFEPLFLVSACFKSDFHIPEFVSLKSGGAIFDNPELEEADKNVGKFESWLADLVLRSLKSFSFDPFPFLYNTLEVQPNLAGAVSGTYKILNRELDESINILFIKSFKSIQQQSFFSVSNQEKISILSG